MQNFKIKLSDFLLKHWLKNFLFMVVACILILVYALFIAKVKYTSRTSILPASTQFAAGIPGQVGSLASLAGIDLSSSFGVSQDMYHEILISNLLINQVLDTEFLINGEKNKLINNLDIEAEVERQLWEKAQKMMREEVLIVKIDINSNILYLSVTLEDPVLSADVANKMIEYLENIVKERVQKEYREKHKTICEYIAENKSKIVTAEKDLQYFLESTRNISTPESEIKELAYRRHLELLTVTQIELKKQLEIFTLKNLTNLRDLLILDKAEVPYEKSRPKRSMLCISLGMLALFLIVFANLLIIVLKNLRVEIQKIKF